MQPVLHSVSEEIRGAVARILAYVGALALLAIAAAGILKTPTVAAVDPTPASAWTEHTALHPSFELLLPEVGTARPHYAIRRRVADGARKDVMTWGAAAADGPFVMLEVYRPGARGERFIDAPSEIAARIVNFSVVDDVKAAGAIDSKFGAMRLVDFAIAAKGKRRRCLGFARPFDRPSMQISGWYCSPGNEAVNRATLACVIDRLTIVSAGGDPTLADLFARAEIRRAFCGQRNPILAATPEHHWTGRRIARLRGRIRPQ